MAGKKAQYENALGSIFDFVFKNSTKKGKGLKPPKPTNFHPTNDFAGALAEMAAQPAYYASDAFMGLFDEAMNQSLVEFYVDKKGGWDKSGRFRVRPREVLTLLRNPSKYVNDVFKKAADERKWSYRGLGSYLDMALGTYWANKKAGFDMQDALRVGKAAGNVSDLELEMLSENMVGENAGVGYLVKAGKLNQARAFSAAIRAEGSRLNHQRLSTILGGLGLTAADRQAISRSYGEKIVGFRKGYVEEDGRVSATMYREVLADNLTTRASIAATQAERDRLMKGYFAVNTWNRLKATSSDVNFKGIKNDIDGAILDLQNRRATGVWSNSDEVAFRRLNRYSDEIGKLEKRGVVETWGKFNTFSDTFDYSRAKRALDIKFDSEIAKAQIDLNKARADLLGAIGGAGNARRLLKEINGLSGRIALLNEHKNQLKTAPFREFRNFFANTFGAIDYVRSVGSGDFLRGIWNGTWFTKQASGKDTAPGIIHPTLGIPVPKSELNPIYASLTQIYYITPPSILKTMFWNGEFFAFRNWQIQQRAFKAFNTPLLKRQLEAAGLLTGNLAKVFKGNSLDPGEFAKQFTPFMAAVSAGGLGNFSNIANSALNSHNRNAALVTRLSWLQNRWKGSRIYKFLFDKKTGVNRRVMRFLGKYLVRLSKNFEWQRAVGLFVKGTYGVRQLVGVGVKAALSALGVTLGGPVGTIIVGLLSEVAMRAGMALAKPILKMLIIIVIFILFLIPLFGMLGIFAVDSLTSAYRHVPPAEALQCIDRNPHSGLYPQPPDEIPGTEYPPIDSQCPLNYSPLICTQGTHGNVSTYHQRTKAIDVRSWNVPEGDDAWYAPTDGSILSYSPSNICADGKDYGGTMKFVDSGGNVYVLLHIRALKSGGNVSKGTALAITRRDLETSDCWTGPHHHLEVVSNGSYQDAYDWYVNKLKCSVSACQ